jgi:soluble lytic murein transglycosylase
VIFFLFRSNWFWNFLSPIFHKDILYKYAGEYKIDPLLIAAIIHSESKFNPVATSKKGALGLMQLLPSTGKEIAKELGINILNEDELYEADKNIRIGFYYMAKLYREFNGNLIFALAAYNAGITRAKIWAKDYHGEDEETLISKIPVSETRKFIKNTLHTYRLFKTIQKIKRITQSIF